MSFSTAMIGGIGGAIIGFFGGGTFDTALQGLQIGTFAGALIDQNKSPSIIGPRLDDLTVQTSTYGAKIPRVYGTVAICGNIFWLENNKLKEVSKKNKSGGKGSSSNASSYTYTYFATFAVGICEGPITGIRRIWINKKLIYDAQSNDIGNIITGNKAAKNFTIYTGSDTQQPDSRMQATLGVANTPAYRGLAYVVFKDLALAKYGNSLASTQIKFEVVKAGEVSRYVSTSVTTPIPADWRCSFYNGSNFVIIGGSPTTLMTSTDCVTWKKRAFPVSGNYSFTSIARNSAGYCIAYDISGREYSLTSKNGIDWVKGIHANHVALRRVVELNDKFIASSGYDYEMYWSADGRVWNTVTLDASDEGGMILVSSGKVALSFKNFNATTYLRTENGIVWEELTLPVNHTWEYPFWFGSFFLVFSDGGNICLKSTDGREWTQFTTPFSAGRGRTAVWDGEYIYVHDTNKTYLSADGGETWFYYTSNDSVYTYDNAIAVEGLIMLGGYDGLVTTVKKYSIDSTSVSLSSVVSSECLHSNFLQAGDIDVTQLSQNVRGYVLSSVAAIRSGLSPLQGAFQFDVIQAGYKIKFKPRGGTSVTTIPAKDLGAVNIS